MSLPVAIVSAIAEQDQANLPIASLQLNGTTSTPGGGAASISTYAWTILDKPAGSAVKFASTNGDTSAASQPTLNTIDTWQNFRVFLRVTDNLGNVSEGDPLLAPDSAFGTIRINSTMADTHGPTDGLQLLAKGERNYQDFARRTNKELDNVRYDFVNRTVNGIFDVAAATSTGPHLDNLMVNSYATQSGAVGGTSLHKHKGADVDPATTAANGTVTLDQTPVSATNPVVLNNEHQVYSTLLNGTYLAGGWSPNVVTVQTNAAGTEQRAHCGFQVFEPGVVTEWGLTWRDGGDNSAGGTKTVALYKMTGPQWNANDFGGATLINTITCGAPAAPHQATHDFTSNLNVSVAARDVLVVFMATDYTGWQHGAAGSGATVTILVKRSV